LVRARLAGSGGGLTNVRPGEEESRLPDHFYYASQVITLIPPGGVRASLCLIWWEKWGPESIILIYGDTEEKFVPLYLPEV